MRQKTHHTTRCHTAEGEPTLNGLECTSESAVRMNPQRSWIDAVGRIHELWYADCILCGSGPESNQQTKTWYESWLRILALSAIKGSFQFTVGRGLHMESTITLSAQRLPLPYVPEIPAEFLRMLRSCSGQSAKQEQSTHKST